MRTYPGEFLGHGVGEGISTTPLHVYGLGGPLTISLLAYLGVDSVDSSSFIICGGNRVYFVPGDGRRSLQELDEKDELPCACPICCKTKPDVLRCDRNSITLHNLWVLLHELKQVRWAIAESNLEGYLKKRYTSTPLMKAAFEYARRKVRHFF
jgi:7-cyano-7-deazaguanine tRNA-ribosyltransferase